ncbi:MAG: tRNA isopentenyl-2-thiomethyl-A-37 hydroxylase MiaE [Gammaproteobacteria bacterium]|nr:tRNA isopentenyl-2-thiomethyl-A-37 hydroxylase MiaE [Gammaproteobacteria bacterium]MDP2139296.1 tRNA isopentenyl-2-thiomethyl-A-37 hydroxylase MiaE [Gammaproteobacteria bacterium]MDP2346781.1 tRNA isopentenyl-2-thiomethyl-A-37 hydroxylase MiaE [Gammaproteobacteria bacterium]
MLSEILDFLPCRTPDAWLEEAQRQQSLLLIDHANCEKKAAATAMNLLYRYSGHIQLLQKMAQLAREELLHFEQVVNLLEQRQIEYRHISASRYASGLREHVRKERPFALTDTLIVGAFVEARSCERFARLAPVLDDQLARFYRGLLKSEARHFVDYLALARLYAEEDITPHIERFRVIEGELITSTDSEFRFHSGVPATAASF